MSNKSLKHDSTSLASSRPRRLNAGIPPVAFDEVTERMELRRKKAAAEAKTAAVKDIDSNRFTGDDSPARDPLEEFRPPTPTGDETVDQAEWEKARVEWLIRYLAVRDTLDVRPALHNHTIGLAQLEEIYKDPDVANELLMDQNVSARDVNESGDEQVIASKSKSQPAPVKTGYAGISIDENDFTVRAKYAPQSQKQKTEAPKAPRPTGLQIATMGSKRTALGRTDSTTVANGQRVTYPLQYTPRSSPLPGNNAPRSSATVQPAQRPSDPHLRTVQGSKTSKPHLIPVETPRLVKKPRLDTKHNGPNQSGRPSEHQRGVTKPSNTTARPDVLRSRAQPGVSSGAQGADDHWSHRISQSRTIRQKPPHNADEPPQQAPNQAVQSAHRDPNDACEGAAAIDADAEQGAVSKGAKHQPKLTGKATVKSFPEDEQPIVSEMTRLAKPYLVANGTYDDTEMVLTHKYKDWPGNWESRVSRNDIISYCFKQACEGFDVSLALTPRHIQCVNEQLTTQRSMVIGRVKLLVEQRFVFSPDQPERNKLIAEKLLPFNFHYLDIKNLRGPFEHLIISRACRTVAFNTGSAIGPRNPEIFDGTPIGYLCYVCALIHHVIWSYRNGEYTNEDLDVKIQTEAFRRAMDYLTNMNTNKVRKLQNIRHEIFDYCMKGHEVGNQPRDPTPEPEREWTPDDTEDYERQYGGHAQASYDTNNADSDVEMDYNED